MDGRVPRASGHSYADTTLINSQAQLGDVYNFDLARDERIKKLILESLAFPEMRWRKDMIKEPHKENWLFSDFRNYRYSSEADKISSARTALMQWLATERSRQPFYISGKPGSGKSMFMKDLRNHDRTIHALTDWAGKDKLIILDHYLWVAGRPLQSSWLGCLRTLLHDCLSALSTENNIALLKTICGERWNIDFQHSSWSVNALTNTLKRLHGTDGVKICLFLDGLDECVPQQEQGIVIERLLDICDSDNLKLIVSSRPWPSLTRALEASHHICLEDLSRNDMAAYVNEGLTRAWATQTGNSNVENDSRALRDLVCEVTHKSEGVFLWTSLVIETLASQIRMGKEFESLFSTLQHFPKDLEAYYKTMIWERVPGVKNSKKDTASALFLAINLEELLEPRVLRVLSVIPYFLLSQDKLGPDMSVTPCVPRWRTRQDGVMMLQKTELYLAETCGDVLTISKTHRASRNTVQFSHRTMLDFFKSDEMASFLAQNIPRHFLHPSFGEQLKMEALVASFSFKSDNCMLFINRLTLLIEHLRQLTNAGKRHEVLLSECAAMAASNLLENCTCCGRYHATPQERPLLFGLFLAGTDQYMSALIHMWPHAVQRPPLLDDAMMAAKSPIGLRSKIVSLIGVLLDTGADPNQRYDYKSFGSHSIWELFLATWRQLQCISADSNDLQCLKQIAAMLIRHGATTWMDCCISHSWNLDVPQGGACIRKNFVAVIKDCMSDQDERDLIKVSNEHSENRDLVNRRQRILAFQSLRSMFPYLSGGKRGSQGLSQPRTVWESLFEVPAAFGPGGMAVDRHHDLKRWARELTASCRNPALMCCACSLGSSMSKVNVCLDCMDFPNLCYSCLASGNEIHEGHHFLRIGEGVLLAQEPYKLERAKLLALSVNDWFEGRAGEHCIDIGAKIPGAQNAGGRSLILPSSRHERRKAIADANKSIWPFATEEGYLSDYHPGCRPFIMGVDRL